MKWAIPGNPGGVVAREVCGRLVLKTREGWDGGGDTASPGRAAERRVPSAHSAEGTAAPRAGPTFDEPSFWGLLRGGGATCGGGEGTGPALLEPPSDTAPGRLKRRGRESGLGSEDEAPGDLEGQGHHGQGCAQASRCRTGFTIKHRRL